MVLINREYLNLFMIILISFSLAILIFSISYYSVIRTPLSEKISAYECGFDPFDDTRSKFDVRFYLIAILFILFDLEVAFLFPLSVMPDIDILGLLCASGFFLLLGVGFYVEWSYNALSWT